jgi:hypothetical protein
MDAGGRATHGAVAEHLDITARRRQFLCQMESVERKVLTRSHALRGNAYEGMACGVLDRRNNIRHSHAERGNEEALRGNADEGMACGVLDWRNNVLSG